MLQFQFRPKAIGIKCISEVSIRIIIDILFYFGRIVVAVVWIVKSVYAFDFVSTSRNAFGISLKASARSW